MPKLLAKMSKDKLYKNARYIIRASDDIVTSSLNILNLFFIAASFFGVLIFLALFFDQNIISSGSKSPEYLRNLSDSIINFFGLSSEDRGTSRSIIINNLAAFIGIFSAIIPFSIYLVNKASLRKALAEIRSQNPFSSHLIENSEDDFEVMSKYYKGARRVFVFSGDFDWIRTNEIIKPTIDRLISEDRIHFISSKSPSIVREAVTQQVYEKIKSKISFNNKYELRGSMITYVGDSRTFIYRYKDTKQEKDIICAIKDFGEGRFLLEAISKMSPYNIGGKKILFLSGYPGSGKTFASNILTKYRFKRISAGDFFRERLRSKGIPETRESLNEEGIRYLLEHGEEKFATEMMSRIGDAHQVVFDGIRPVATIKKIQEEFPNSKVVFIAADNDIREQRLLSRGLTRSEVNFIRSAPIESHNNEIRAIANIVIDNHNNDRNRLEIDIVTRLDLANSMG